MDVRAEAKRIMAVSVGKLYSSRTQRGGLRLHRSLLLSAVMRCARDLYHAAEREAASAVTTVNGVPDPAPVAVPEPTPVPDADDKENQDVSLPARASRKRPGKPTAEPDFLPPKKARLETEEERRAPLAPSNNGGVCRRAPDALAPLPACLPVAAC